MRAARTLLAAALALALPHAAARAETFASPSAGFQGTNQIVCYLGNAGSSAITVRNPLIYDSTGGAFTLSINTCPASLAGGRICVWAVNLSPPLSFFRYHCRVDLSSKANARGTMDLRVVQDARIARVVSLEMR